MCCGKNMNDPIDDCMDDILYTHTQIMYNKTCMCEAHIITFQSIVIIPIGLAASRCTRSYYSLARHVEPYQCEAQACCCCCCRAMSAML